MNKHGIAFLTIFCFIIVNNSLAQDTTISLAFKNNKPERKTNFFYQPDLSYQLWQQFNLIKEANAGNSNAQHELGIRYFLGDGMRADTIQGAYWIKKAADQKLMAAAFNFGILLLNGWGVEWNPFHAFNYFLQAASDGMPQAQHLVGILHTDNLIIKRDWNKAYTWIKKASDAGYEPAKATLESIAKKVDVSSLDTSKINSGKTVVDKNQTANNQSLPSSLGLVFIDFDSVQDTSAKIESKDLLEDLTLLENEELNSSIYLKKNADSSKQNEVSVHDSVLSFDSLDLSLLLKFAENGSPEALTMIGRFYEEGKFYKKNLITAAAFYIRAIRLDSPRAPVLLYDMLRSVDISGDLKTMVDKNDPEAMFVWHGLHTLGFDNRITGEDAFKLLQKSAASYYIPSIVELGLLYYTGKIQPEDQEKGLAIWKEAERMGSKEASVRIETAIIFSSNNFSKNQAAFEALSIAAENGSLLAQVSIAHCYETSKGVKNNNAEAVKYYRLAARRGSQYAYKKLQEIFDSVRPDDEFFNLN